MPDGWTVVTADGSLSAHFEHTIAVTQDGHEVLDRPGLSRRFRPAWQGNRRRLKASP